MLTPLLILCAVTWFVALTFIWSAVDKHLLDKGQQVLRDNADMLTKNNKPGLALLATSELQTYPPAHIAAVAISVTLAVFVAAAGVILYFRKWRSKLRPITVAAVAATLVYLILLTVQAWTSLYDACGVAWVAVDCAAPAITLALVLAAGVTQDQL